MRLSEVYEVGEHCVCSKSMKHEKRNKARSNVEKRHKCHRCHKSFAKNFELLRHFVVHTSECALHLFLFCSQVMCLEAVPSTLTANFLYATKYGAE